MSGYSETTQSTKHISSDEYKYSEKTRLKYRTYFIHTV